ncbi:MAG: DUF502 domain-containing protein [Gemmatimonadetes bacterium]|nr:DUF502 domain-containing protein [Gemmatimonadota bacterium]
MRRIRRYLLEGLALVVPIGATAWILLWLFRRLDGILGPYLDPVLGRSAPGLGIIALVALLVAIGWLAERTLGRRATQLWTRTVERVPLVRPLYRGSRRIVQAVLGEESRAFKETVLFEYPHPGTWSVGFVTGKAPPGLPEAVGSPAVTVFLPTAPNPLSGFLLIMPRARTHPLSIPPDEALTFVLSMGSASIDPEGPRADSELGGA